MASYGALSREGVGDRPSSSMRQTAVAVAVVAALCLFGVAALVGSGAAHPSVMPMYTSTTTAVRPFPSLRGEPAERLPGRFPAILAGQFL